MQEDEAEVVLGPDTHKRSHTVAAIAAATGELRSLERFLIERGKSDPIDAAHVARAALQERLASFPAAQLDGHELDLRLLVDHRERLVRQRVELNSTLLWHLHDSAARCSRGSGARGSAGGWPGPSSRCAFGSPATSCAACASSGSRWTA